MAVMDESTYKWAAQMGVYAQATASSPEVVLHPADLLTLQTDGFFSIESSPAPARPNRAQRRAAARKKS